METTHRTSLLVLSAAFVIVIWGLIGAEAFLVPLLLAGLVAFAMAPAVRLFKRLKFPEWACITLTALLVIVPLLSIAYVAVNEIQKLVSDWPHLQSSLLDAAARFRSSEFAERFHLQDYLDPEGLTDRLSSAAGDAAKLVLGGMLQIFSAGTRMVLVLFFAVVMVASRHHLQRATAHAVARYSRGGKARFVDEIGGMIEAFLAARLAITLVTGIAGLIVGIAFGLPYVFVIFLFFGIMTWVPTVGMILALLPPIAVAIAAGKSPGAIVVMTAILVAIWALQDHVLTPKWLGSKLQLNFLSTYLALFGGAQLWGPWGMFLGVPLLGVIRIALAASKDLEPIAFALADSEEQKKG